MKQNKKKGTLLNLIKRKISEAKIEKQRPKSEPQINKFKILNTLNGSIDSFENKIINEDSTIGIVLGARGKGKSAIGIRILENLKTQTDRKLFAMGFKKGLLPNWITEIEELEQIENNSFVVIDESGVEFSSRNSMSSINKLFSRLLLIARHKNLSLILISQNSSNIDVNGIRQADYLILKPSSLLQRDFERKKIREIYEEVDDYFLEFKEDKGLAYIYSDEFTGFISNSLPSFWCERVSKAYR